jgi:hydrogenase maturation protease
MNPPRILIAGIGNIFFGDDAFGTEVARRLLRRSWPDNVHVGDFGIRSYDLVYALLDGYDVTILIDAIARGEPPGTVYVIEPDLSDDQLPQETQVDGHKMNPLSVLAMAKQMGGPLNRVLLVGCEPAYLGTAEGGRLGFSEPVGAALDEAVGVIDSLVSDQYKREPQASGSCRGVTHSLTNSRP